VLQIGVAKNQPLLASILDKALQSIPDDEPKIWSETDNCDRFDHESVLAHSMEACLIFYFAISKLLQVCILTF